MEATEKLLRKFPPELSVVTFCNSGSEANDLALQMAEIRTGRRGVICLEGAYHGVTRATMEISPYKWNEKYPRPNHVTIAKSPCTYRGALCGKTDSK
jgi:4-aminobutyrate aminotransferase-like enzyme